MTTDVSLKQPPVFKLAFLTATCERFGFYVLSFLLVLYAKTAFGFSDTSAFLLFSVFTALAYLTTAIGGYLADNVFGIRRCMIFGLLSETAGLCLAAVPNKSTFTLALALVILGVGLFKTGPTHLMGRSYKENDHRIDSGFTLYYMGMNVGPMISSLIIGFIQRYFGWPVAFIVGGLGIFGSLCVYAVLRKSAESVDTKVGTTPLPIKKWVAVLGGYVVALVFCSFLVMHTTFDDVVIILATVLILGYFVFEIIRSPMAEKRKIAACASLILIGLGFYILYFQAYTSIILFVNRSVTRSFFGFEIPTVVFFFLNPLWVIVLSPFLAWFYNSLRRNNSGIPITIKFSFGLLFASLSFFCLVISSFFANSVGQVSPFWIALAFAIYTLGELLVAALGVAMVTHIAPKRMYGVMMGSWFLAGMSLSSILSGLIAGIANVPAAVHDPFTILHIYKVAFFKMGLGGLAFTALSFIVGPFIKRLAEVEAEK